MLKFKTEFCDSEEDEKTQIALTLILQGTIFIITDSLLGCQSMTAQHHTKKGNKVFSHVDHDPFYFSYIFLC